MMITISEHGIQETEALPTKNGRLEKIAQVYCLNIIKSLVMDITEVLVNLIVHHKKIDIFKLQKFESLDLAAAYTISA